MASYIVQYITHHELKQLEDWKISLNKDTFKKKTLAMPKYNMSIKTCRMIPPFQCLLRSVTSFKKNLI